jgi:hypothetical protein
MLTNNLVLTPRGFSYLMGSSIRRLFLVFCRHRVSCTVKSIRKDCKVLSVFFVKLCSLFTDTKQKKSPIFVGLYLGTGFHCNPLTCLEFYPHKQTNVAACALCAGSARGGARHGTAAASDNALNCSMWDFSFFRPFGESHYIAKEFTGTYGSLLASGDPDLRDTFAGCLIWLIGKHTHVVVCGL